MIEAIASGIAGHLRSLDYVVYHNNSLPEYTYSIYAGGVLFGLLFNMTFNASGVYLYGNYHEVALTYEMPDLIEVIEGYCSRQHKYLTDTSGGPHHTPDARMCQMLKEK